MSSLCKEQLSYSRSQSFSSWFCMRMDLSSLWPWSFTFYVCVESLFDRLVVRGQIESFRIKSNPQVFGYRSNFPVWNQCLGKAQFHLDPKLLRQSSGSSCFLTIPFILWDFSWPRGGCAGTDSSVLALPLGTSLLVQLPPFLAEQEEVGSVPQLTLCLAAEQEGPFVPSFLSGVNFIVAVTVPAIS